MAKLLTLSFLTCNIALQHHVIRLGPAWQVNLVTRRPGPGPSQISGKTRFFYQNKVILGFYQKTYLKKEQNDVVSRFKKKRFKAQVEPQINPPNPSHGPWTMLTPGSSLIICCRILFQQQNISKTTKSIQKVSAKRQIRKLSALSSSYLQKEYNKGYLYSIIWIVKFQ